MKALVLKNFQDKKTEMRKILIEMKMDLVL